MAAAGSADAVASLNITPAVMGKAAASAVMMAAGLYYLATGRRDADMGRILMGAALTLGSVLVF